MEVGRELDCPGGGGSGTKGVRESGISGTPAWTVDNGKKLAEISRILHLWILQVEFCHSFWVVTMVVT